MLMTAVQETIDSVEGKISNLRYGNLGEILFEYGKKTYTTPEPDDVMPVGAKQGNRWAAWQLIKGKAKYQD